jgi:hypothetical protein
MVNRKIGLSAAKRKCAARVNHSPARSPPPRSENAGGKLPVGLKTGNFTKVKRKRFFFEKKKQKTFGLWCLFEAPLPAHFRL